MRFVLLFLLLTGCASIPKGLNDFDRDSYLKNGEYDRVLKDMEMKEKFVSDKDLLLHKLNYAQALHYAGQYKKSNQVFTECQAMIDWGNDLPEAEKILGGIFTNGTRRFQLDEYEILTISFIKMLNALLLGQLDNAQAESRRLEKVGLFLKEHKRENLLEESDFHYYFSGLIWETFKRTDYKHLDMAYVNYKRAFNNHSSIKYLPFDLARVAVLSGRRSEVLNWISHPTLQQAYPKFVESEEFKTSGELVIIFMNGFGPRKAPDAESNNMFLTSVPRVRRVEGFKLSVDGDEIGEGTPVLNIDKLAEKNLKARKNGVLGHLGNATGLYNNHDTRSWDLIPKEVQLARVILQEGSHHIQMEVLGADWQFIKKSVVIKKGQKTFLHIYLP